MDSVVNRVNAPRGLADRVRARVAFRGGRRIEALRLLEQGAVNQWFGLAVTSPLQSQAPERYLRAELLQAAGRLEEAIGWYASFGEHGLHDLVYLAPSLFRRGELYEALGKPVEAMIHYARFAEMWQDADPELQPVVQQARNRIARLRSEHP
jgi:tetratricopeptide (TPR) repeat protein